MAEQQPENIVLVDLRRMDEKLDRLADDVRDLKGRMTAVELALAGVRRDIVLVTESVAQTNARIDRVDIRLERVERRLDLVGTTPS
jgi:outer membrane murein-binding lipoprotein Lpp